MFASIILLAKLPGNLDTLEYRVPEPLMGRLAPGDFVVAPFRQNKLPGVVLEVYETSRLPHLDPAKIQPLWAKRSEYLPKTYLETLKLSAEYFAVNLSKLAYALIPAPPKKIKDEPLARAESQPRLFGAGTDLEFGLDSSNPAEQLAYLETVIARAKSQAQSALILVPTKSELDYYKQQLPKKNLQILSEELSGKALWDFWRAGLELRPRILLTTRRGVLFPLPNLGQIVIMREEDQNHKQYDMNPRYDSRRVAKILSTTLQTPIHSLSLAPRVTTRFGNPKAFWQQQAPRKAQISLIFSDTISADNLLVPGVEERLEKLAETRQKFAIITQISGASTLVFCPKCRQSLKCPHCDVPLKSIGVNVTCFYCGYRDFCPVFCPECKSVKLSSSGLGSETLKNILAAHFPDLELAVMFGTAYELMHDRKFQTELLSVKTLFWLYPELALSSHEFTENERLFSELRHGLRLLAPGSDLAIVTTANLPIYEALATAASEERFYQKLLEERAGSNYPPTGRLIKLIFQAVNASDANQAALEAKNRLFGAPEIEILGPYEPYPKRVRMRFRSFLLLKGSPAAIQALKPKLKVLGDEILIEVDPDRIFR
ncbi:MAG: hypothetical protein V1821_04460 [bacterium]